MVLNQEEIKQIIPHRDPFLFLDEVLECEVAKRTKAVWRIREDLFCFRGHFPGNPILPGVLITEALAQNTKGASRCSAGSTACGSAAW